MSRLTAPSNAPIVKLRDLDGNIIPFGDGCRTLLSFFRDPMCPFCNFHLYFMTSKYKELQQHGLKFIAVFPYDPNDPEPLEKYILARRRPFPIAVEPNHVVYQLYGTNVTENSKETEDTSDTRNAYAQFGIEKSFWRKMLAVLLHPIMWLRGMTIVGATGSAKALGGINTVNNLPADFLINENGDIVEAYYGKEAGDHIPYERIKSFAAEPIRQNYTT